MSQIPAYFKVIMDKALTPNSLKTLKISKGDYDMLRYTNMNTEMREKIRKALYVYNKIQNLRLHYSQTNNIELE